MTQIKKYKKEIIIFFVVLIVSLIMCSAFLKPHYTHDTYRIIYDGYEYYSYDKFLKEARPFTALLTLMADKINLTIENYMIISLILALIFLSLSVVLIYKMFIKQYNSTSRLKEIIVLLISYIVIFNYLAIEHIYFLECCVLALGILLSVIAAKFVINNEKYKYVKAFLLIIIAVFCYQGSIAIFPILVFTYRFLFQNNAMKEDFKDIIKVVLIYGISMLLTILFAEFIMGGSRIQINANPFDISSIMYWLYELAVNSLGVILPYFNLGLVLLTILFIFIFKKTTIKEKIIYTLKYLLVILAAIVICITPILVGSGLELTPRMCIAYGCTIGISLFVILYIVDRNNNKYQNIFIYVITIIIFILNFSLYIVLTNQHLIVNNLDRENCEKIKEIINKYEEENNIEVTKIAGIRRLDGNKYYPGFIHAGAITQKALNSWALRETISFYIGKHLEYAPITSEQYQEFFAGKAWEEFSEEQVVIEDGILYFCGN